MPITSVKIVIVIYLITRKSFCAKFFFAVLVYHHVMKFNSIITVMKMNCIL